MRALIGALRATSGAAGLRRGLPIYAGLFAIAGLLFGGNGLEAGTVVAGIEGSRPVAGLLWSGWLVISMPVLAALWRCPASYWLRSLPAPRWMHLAALLVMSAIAEAPWVWLWSAGGGVTGGLAGLGGALAVHALILARGPGAIGLVGVGIGLVGVIAAPRWCLAFGTWPIVLVGFRAAWLAAPARGAGHARAWIVGAGALALASAHLIGLLRGHAATLLRGGLLVGVAAAAAWLAAWNNLLALADERLLYACGFVVPAALGAGSATMGPLWANEARARWLLRTVGATARSRWAASCVASAIVGLGLGGLASAALAAAWGLAVTDALVLAGALALTCGGLATLAGQIARWAAGQGVRGPGRAIGALLGVLVAALVVHAYAGAWAPVSYAGAAVMTWLLGHVVIGPAEPRGGATVQLEMTEIHKRLGGRAILAGVDLRCEAGELALVLGENGAGKSTLLRIAAGVVEPDRGSVAIGGAALAGGGVAARARLGYVPDTSDAFPELSVRELIALVGALRRAEAPDPALRERLGLAAIWQQRLRTLSFGQVKRAYLLAALVGSPPLLILDEPSNGLDPDGAAMLAELLRERARDGHAALIATNDAGFAALLPGGRWRLLDGRLNAVQG